MATTQSSVTCRLTEASPHFEPARARAVFRAEGALAGPTHVSLKARDHAIEVDEPEVLAGADAHANPVEYATP